MNEKVNVAELLRYSPRGMELDCTMLDNIVLEVVDVSSYKYPIVIRNIKTNKTIYLTKYGQFVAEDDYKCVIFPKGKTTWDGFVPLCNFKDGDVVTNIEGAVIIYKEVTTSGYCGSFVSLDRYNQLIPHYTAYLTGSIRLSTEEEKEKLFKAIKDNGYRWNAETNTLVELIKPKFKVGDYVTKKGGITIPVLISRVGNDYYYSDMGNSVGVFRIKEQDDWELVPNKFDVTTLKPFDKVLVRNSNKGHWRGQFYMAYAKNEEYPFECTYDCWMQCIPYEGNEHLLATTYDCDEYYKNW